MKTPEEILELYLMRFSGSTEGFIYVSPSDALLAIRQYADQFKNPTKKTIEERKEEFICMVQSASLFIPRDEMLKFIDYWTEKSLKGRKMRFEKEPTFDVVLRLSRWMNNKKTFNNGNQPKPNHGEQRDQARIDYLNR